MKKILGSVIVLLLSLPLFAQNSTMGEGASTMDSYEAGTMGTESVDSVNLEEEQDEEQQAMEEKLQDNVDAGSGTGVEYQNENPSTPDDWEEEE